jgi:cytochrome c oxidase subunit 1
VENWKGEPPLVHEPYGYGIKPGDISLTDTSGRDLWRLGAGSDSRS